MSPEPDNILNRLEELDSKFRSLHQALLSELESKKVPVRKLVNSLTLLPIQLRQEYERAISSKLPDLRGEDEAGDVFRYHLNPLVNFLDYGLIKYVIEQFGSSTLKSMMTTYSGDILVFMKKTTVKQLMDIWPGQQKIPHNFSILRAKLDEDPTTYTLYQLDQLRRRFCGEVKLTEIVLVLIGLETANSFIVEWLIPSALVPQLMESAKKLGFGFFLREHILKMTVDEKRIFPMLPDAKPKVPALQAAAATVTDLPEVHSTSEHSITEQVEQLSLSIAQHEVQRIRDELRDYALYSGVAVIGDMVGEWKHIEPHLSSSGYKVSHLHDIVSLSHPHHFTTIAQSITYPERPTSAESSHSSPFVIAVFVSGLAQSAHHTLYGEVNVVNDIIQPFLPQSAPHLQHIPKLFFIIAWDSPSPVLPPQLADDPDGNYCVAYFVTKSYIRVKVWIHHIIKNLFLPSTTVSEAVENSRFFIDKDEEYLYYFTCLKNKVVLKK